MKAILMTDKGSSDVLQIAEIAEPKIKQATEVKIKIKAAGINPIDTKVRRNGLFYAEPLPVILGCDGAGEIVETGDAISEFNIGDEVWFCHGGLGKEPGNYAQYTVIDGRWLALKPKNIRFFEAAAMPLVLITAWNALFVKGNLQPGETVLIHAGAGGVGHIAIQLAKLKGAKVIVTVSSNEKASFAKSLGADHSIIYSQNDFVEVLDHLTAEKGADLVFDTVGGEVFSQSILATRYFGRLITLLDPSEQNLQEARIRNLLIGFELMLTPLLKGLDGERDKHINILKQCVPWVEQGLLKVHVSERFSMQKITQAHALIEQGHTVGKIVLDIATDSSS
ncbi:MAG: zinc-dependent alcohol dehydrogenase family protein [Methylococcales symbiont of Hymedesmia sp. n. MRB-2018]|nr:MAG: zinc-dependent alcohol dehydrogenase family protein [Methylococcales symbiont of Hymedesmia sp. n. MRB-2018]